MQKIDLIKIKDDKRVKLSDSDKATIRVLYESGWAINAIARRYEVCKRTIQFILFPERLDRNKALRRERLLVDPQRYYDKEKHTLAIKDLRERKKAENSQLYNKVCPICNKKFWATRTDQIYCGKRCMWTSNNRKRYSKH